jgi:catechol 2,3-dioxygenase-like lactoylglutathione lyase family enzyme
MLKGLRTIVYPVSDAARAKSWYSEILGIEPYFDEPFYIGFDVGGYELGLDPNGDSGGPPVTYWGVDDAGAAHRDLIARGAKPHRDVQDVGEGIRLGSVIDADGNIIGVIQNPHFVARG